MSRKRQDAERSETRNTFNSPFRDLKKLVRPVLPQRRPTAPKTAPLADPPPEIPESDEELFQRAAAGAVPIPQSERHRVSAPPPRSPSSLAGRDDAEALAELCDLIAGTGEFHVSDTDEYVEGMVAGLDPRMLHKLREGEFSYQAHLDLHGMTADEAKTAVRQFVMRALRAGHRCVLLVHGRGRNSPDQRSVLKDRVKSWLTRGELSRVVLAFSTARSCDGGAGATYVLLRRARRQKTPFRTYEGTKS